MKKDKLKTAVMFRKETKDKEFKGEIFALFPYEEFSPRADCTSYAHIGQHGGADYKFSISASKPATPEEYKDLKTELESLGYNLQIIQKRNTKKYLKSIKS